VLRELREKGFVIATLSELILVGDEEKDRLTAENVGCRFIRIDRKGTGNGDICNLNELLRMLF